MQADLYLSELTIATAGTRKMTPEPSALIVLMHRYLSASIDPAVTILVVHHFMYFMQAAGKDLDFQYERSTYKPRFENVLPVLNQMETHFITIGPDEDGCLQDPVYLKRSVRQY